MPTSYISEITNKYVTAPGVAKAAVAAVAWRGGADFRCALGPAFARPTAASDVETFFDLASISKSFTACTVARLVRSGQIDFETPLQELLPEARDTHTGKLPISLLLAHRAGLKAHLPLFTPLLSRLPFEPENALAAMLHGRRPECLAAPPNGGYPPLYSDLGFALVGVALSRSQRLSLDELIQREVTAPLGIAHEVGSSRLLRAQWTDFAKRCAPTEVVPFRGGLVHGVVHDENAWALSGHGSSGHAGLFGTALGVARFGVALLNAESGRSSAWLDQVSLAPLLAQRPGSTLRAGFDGKSADQSSAGSKAGPRSFGHLGFTGTSFWCDPDAERVMVLLTNRVHPTRNNPTIAVARPAVNDALFAFPELNLGHSGQAHVKAL